MCLALHWCSPHSKINKQMHETEFCSVCRDLASNHSAGFFHKVRRRTRPLGHRTCFSKALFGGKHRAVHGTWSSPWFLCHNGSDLDRPRLCIWGRAPGGTAQDTCVDLGSPWIGTPKNPSNLKQAIAWHKKLQWFYHVLSNFRQHTSAS